MEGGEKERAWERSGERRRAESGKAGNGAEKATHTQLLSTKPFISCKVTTSVSTTPRVTYVTAKRLRARRSVHSFGTLCYCPVQTVSAQGTRRKGGGCGKRRRGTVQGAVKKEWEACIFEETYEKKRSEGKSTRSTRTNLEKTPPTQPRG